MSAMPLHDFANLFRTNEGFEKPAILITVRHETTEGRRRACAVLSPACCAPLCFRALPLQGSHPAQPVPGAHAPGTGCRSFGAGSSPKGAVENSQGRQPLDPGFLREEP